MSTSSVGPSERPKVPIGTDNVETDKAIPKQKRFTVIESDIPKPQLLQKISDATITHLRQQTKIFTSSDPQLEESLHPKSMTKLIERCQSLIKGSDPEKSDTKFAKLKHYNLQYEGISELMNELNTIKGDQEKLNEFKKVYENIDQLAEDLRARNDKLVLKINFLKKGIMYKANIIRSRGGESVIQEVKTILKEFESKENYDTKRLQYYSDKEKRVKFIEISHKLGIPMENLDTSDFAKAIDFYIDLKFILKNKDELKLPKTEEKKIIEAQRYLKNRIENTLIEKKNLVQWMFPEELKEDFLKKQDAQDEGQHIGQDKQDIQDRAGY